MKKLMIFFAAGAIGALINSLVVWQFGQQGISQSLGVAIAPGLSATGSTLALFGEVYGDCCLFCQCLTQDSYLKGQY